LTGTWVDYKNASNVDSSSVYVYDGDYRWGYVDTNKNGLKDVTETLLESVAEFDNEGNIVSVTSYEEDGATISSVSEFDWPESGYTATRILDEEGDTVQLSKDGQMMGMMTLTGTWVDYKNASNVDSSSVYVYDGDYRWGYVDTNKNGLKDVTETLLESVAEFDNEGNIVSVTSYDNDGATISTVTKFNWPYTKYTVTRIVNNPAGKDTIQISDDNNSLYAIMTMSSLWGDYTNPADVSESTIYVYTQDGDNRLRTGYVDTNKNAIRDAGEDNLDSVMLFDNDGDIISITGYLADGETMEYIVTYDHPMPDWSTQRSINNPFTRDSITIFDNEGRIRATQTTEGTLLDGPPASETITESTVYVYENTVRWGYTDVAKNGVYDADNDTILENKVQFDSNGKVVSATYWNYDETTQTLSLFRIDEYNKEFGETREGYVTTTLFDYPGPEDQQIQVSNPDGKLTKKREWDNATQTWTYIIYDYPLEDERYGYIDHDNNGTVSAGDQLESRAKFDANENLISNTVLFRSGGAYWNQGEIRTITHYNYNGTISTKINKMPQEGSADGDYTTYNYNRDGNLYRIDHFDISEGKLFADYLMNGFVTMTEIYAITVTGTPPIRDGNVTIGALLEVIYKNTQTLPDGRVRVTDPDTGLIQIYNSQGQLVESTDNQKVVNIYYYDNEGNFVREDNLGYKIVWYGDPSDPNTGYTVYYNQLNSITTYEFTVPLGRGNEWRMIQNEYWADGLLIQRDFETQDIISIVKYERDSQSDLVTETVIYQHRLKTVTEMNWPQSGWRAVLIPGGAENDNDAVMIIDNTNKLRGYMEILKSSSYKSTGNIILSVVYDYDTSGNQIGYVDANKDGIWQSSTETTMYSYTEKWSVDETKEVTRIFKAGGDIIEIRDATFNGKLRAKIVLNGTGFSYDYNNPLHVATSNLYLYNSDGSWDIYVENTNKNGIFDNDGSETDTGYDGVPNERSHNGAMMQVLDNEGNIISNTFGSGYMVDYMYDNEGNYLGTRETRYFGSTYYYDNEGNPYPEGIIDYHGNYIHIDPTSGSYMKHYKEFETDGSYSGTYNLYSGGLLATQINSQGQITYKKYTSAGTTIVLENNGGVVHIANPSNPSDIDAQILAGGEYKEWHDTGYPSLIAGYNSGDGSLVTRLNSSGYYQSQTLVDGSFYDTSGSIATYQYYEMDHNYFYVLEGSTQYVFLTQEYSNIVQNVTAGVSLTIQNNGTTPTNIVDNSKVYKWTEDSGSTTVYRFNGINRYFNSSGVLQKTVWSDATGTVQRTLNYGASLGGGLFEINSVVDGNGSSLTLNRSGSTITGFDITVGTNTTIAINSAGKTTSLSTLGHIQTYDSSGNVTSITTADGLVQLSSNGKVNSVTDVDGTTMTYNRDGGGNIVSVIVEDATLGMRRFYEVFSSNLRLSSVTESSGRLSEYYYNTSGSIRTYSDATPTSYSVIVTDGDTVYRYGYRPDGGIPGLYLYNVTHPDYMLTYTRHSTYPYYILSQQLVIYGPEISGTQHNITLEFFGSSWKTGGNYLYGDLYYITGTRFGTEYAVKNP
ncbi:MAG: DUF2963 domain-containing protein, partial [Candidatus Auribacterota bacterium]|jgi:YD repeat-containing protein|nr:DUF2963 domain-containing protein [Candidatus Auribacterota bacterium]